MEFLPPEVVVHILSYLPQHELLSSVTRVSKLWKDLSLAPPLWCKLTAVKIDEETEMLYMQNIEKVCCHIKYLFVTEDFLKRINSIKPKCSFLNLRKLDLSSVYLTCTDVIVQFFSKCTQLDSVSVRFDDIDFREIIPQLSELKLKHLKICYSGDDADFLSLLQDIRRQQCFEVLSVLCNTIQNQTVSFLLTSFNCIKSLDVTSRYLKNDTFLSLTRMPRLTTLVLDYTRIDDNGMNHVALNVPNLKYISLIRCEEITDVGFRYLTSNCPLLEQVTICKSHSISGNSLISLGEGCHRLQRLTIMACSQIDDKGVGYIVSNCHSLRVLILNYCISLTDHTLNQIANHCSFLRKLDISHNGKFTSVGISNVIRSCLWLESVSCASCGSINQFRFYTADANQLCAKEILNNDMSTIANSDEDVKETLNALVGRKHCHLKSINFSHTAINTASVLELSFFCPDLRNIYMYGCVNVKQDIVEVLFRSCVFMKREEILLHGLLQKTEKKLAQSFNVRFRYINDVLSLLDHILKDYLHRICPTELDIKETDSTS